MREILFVELPLIEGPPVWLRVDAIFAIEPDSDLGTWVHAAESRFLVNLEPAAIVRRIGEAVEAVSA